MDESTPQASEAWKEVGERFEQLGRSLAETIQTAWKNEQVRSQAEEMKSGLEALVQQVGAAVKETGESQDLHREAGATAKSVQTAGEQTVEELRPHLIDALHELDQQLQKLIRGIETEEPEKAEEQ